MLTALGSILFNGPVRIVLTIIVALVLLWILLRFRTPKDRQKGSLDIMKGRLEKGEITEKEYEEAKRRQGKQ
ncbi:SHOCT domain-containing protein [Virgibacillus sp. W0181]|uniref:SHOCT domain-containing protein n=1 Tax=Virgibacillus sp. W0181 TaxID=3391581 RepID=UPI003F451DED